MATTREQPSPLRGRLGLWWPYLGDGIAILGLSLWVGHRYLLAGNDLIANSWANGFGDPYLHLGVILNALNLLGQGVVPVGTAWVPSVWAGLPGVIGVFGLPSLADWVTIGLTPFAGVYAAYNLVTFLGIVVAAVSAYYLGYVVTGKRGAAIIVASAYAYAPQSYTILFYSRSQIDVEMSYAWLPLMVAFWEKLLRQPTRRHMVLTSLGTILVFLSYPQTGLYGAIVIALRLAFQVLYLLSQKGGVISVLRLAGASAVATTLALSVLLPIYLPAMLLRPISRSYQEAADLSVGGARFAPGELILILVAMALGIIGFRL